MRLMFTILFAFALAAVVLPAVASAAPTTLALQGSLRSVGGGPVADGDYPVGVALYDAADAVQPLWSENLLAVSVVSGLFSIDAGASDPAKPLDDSLFVPGAALWVGVTVGGDPELPRQQLARVPFAHAASVAGLALDVDCSGCVGPGELGAGAVTQDAIATGAVQNSHVAFTYAGANTKGGPALAALNADTAAFADEAASAQLALSLGCTGCVAATALAADVVDGLVASGKLAKVAQTGAYADLSGGPDLSPYAVKDAPNTFSAPQTFGDDVDFGANEAKLFRFHNNVGAPAPCTADTVGMAYYDTQDNALRVCNGAQFVTFAKALPLGSQGNPAASCQAILDAGEAAGSGLYWLTLEGASSAHYCDMTTEGGGWTLAGVVTNKDGKSWGHASGAWEDTTTFGSAAIDANADYKGAAFSKLPAKDLMVGFAVEGQAHELVALAPSCLPETTLAGHFAGLGWSCGGSAALSSGNSCTHACAVTKANANAADLAISEGSAVSHLWLKAGEADGAQDNNKDRAYISGTGRTNVDAPKGLGSFCSGGSCSNPGEVDAGQDDDGALAAPADRYWTVWVR